MYITYESAKALRDELFTVLILSLLISFLAGANLFWLANDTRPPSWDQSTHLILSIKYFKIFSAPSRDIFKRLLDVSSYYPPFYHLSLIPSLWLFGISHNSAAIVNILYLALLVIFTYKIGAYLFDQQTGLLAAFVVSMYQFLIYLSRSCLIDVALAAFVVMTLYFLLRAENFYHTKPTLIFGLLFGVGMLTKWTFLFFLLVPLIIAIVKVIRRLERPLNFVVYLIIFIFLVKCEVFLIWPYKIAALLLLILTGWRLWSISRSNEVAYLSLKNILCAFLVAFIIAAPWYLYNLVKLARHITANVGQIAVAEGDPSILSLKSLFYYLGALSDQVQLVFFILFLLGFVWLFIKWDKKNSLLLQWFLVPYLIFVLVRNKDPRFTVPYLPAVSIISVFWIANLDKKYLKNIIIYSILIIGIGQFFLFSYKIKYFPPKVELKTPVYNLSLYSAYPPLEENWQHKEIFNAITIDFKQWNKLFALVRVLSNYSYFHGESFEVYTIANELPIYPIGYRRNLGEFTDYLIFKTGDRGPAFSIRHYDEAVKEIETSDPAFTSVFTVLEEVSLPDGSKGIIYKRKVKSQENVSLPEVELKLTELLGDRLLIKEGLKIEITPFSPEDTAKGRFEKIIIRLDKTRVQGLAVEKAEAELEDVRLSLYHLWYKDQIVLFSVRKLHPSLIIDEGDLKDFLNAKIENRYIEDLEVSLQNGLIIITGHLKWHGLYLPVNITSSISLDDKQHAILTRIKQVAVGPFRIPGFLYGALVNRTFTLWPTSDWSMPTEIREIETKDGKLIIQ